MPGIIVIHYIVCTVLTASIKKNKKRILLILYANKPTVTGIMLKLILNAIKTTIFNNEYLQNAVLAVGCIEPISIIQQPFFSLFSVAMR